MRIAVDVMGGDRGAADVVRGALDAADAFGHDILLVGQRDQIEPHVSRQSNAPQVEVIDAPDVIAMGEHPAMAVRRKPRSSLVAAMRLVKEGRADAFVSPGNSGAVMAAAVFLLGLAPDVERPAIGMLFPGPRGAVLILDVGASVDCKATHLVQFARLGSQYMEAVSGVASPRVGLLSNGSEETKGNQLVQETHRLLKEAGLSFIGNVEANDIPQGKADVVVTDGFAGNVLLKGVEGFGEMVFGELRQRVTASLRFRLGALLLRPALRAIATRLDYREYGGAPLLGVRGAVVIAHGRSDARAIRNAVRVAGRIAAGQSVLRPAPAPPSA